MGMFDYLLHEGVRYQTKDTPAQWLMEYRIENGRLVTDEGRHVEVPKHERPYPNAEGILGLIGSIRFVVDRPSADQNWHGFIECTRDGEPYDEYLAKFTDGNLVSFEKC